MEVARQRVREVAAHKKEEEKKAKEKESLSAPKVVKKGVTKRKGNGKDDLLSKKALVTPREKLPKKPSPLKHGAGKGLMMAPDLITQDSERRLLTHKDYAVEMLATIIKDKDVDPCVGQATGKLEDSSLFDISRVCFFHLFFYSFVFMLTS